MCQSEAPLAVFFFTKDAMKGLEVNDSLAVRKLAVVNIPRFDERLSKIIDSQFLSSFLREFS